MNMYLFEIPSRPVVSSRVPRARGHAVLMAGPGRLHQSASRRRVQTSNTKIFESTMRSVCVRGGRCAIDAQIGHGQWTHFAHAAFVLMRVALSLRRARSVDALLTASVAQAHQRRGSERREAPAQLA